VGRGAAIMATKLGGELDPRSQLAAIPVPVDAASHGLGVTVVTDERTMELGNLIIIPNNAPIPATGKDTVTTIVDNQTEIKVDLNEGDHEDLDFVRKLGSNIGQFARPVPKGYPIRIEISYTADQTINLHAYDDQTGKLLCEIEVQHESLMTKAEKSRARDFLARVDVQ
jgi:molecular chaperone DnaK